MTYGGSQVTLLLSQIDREESLIERIRQVFDSKVSDSCAAEVSNILSYRHTDSSALM